ncbi:MAG: heme-binding protein [Dehalococcoidales bacterium]|nr:heme-binding protein [Dehalococcoidales bacterium]
MHKAASSTPSVWKTGKLCYSSGLTLEIAKKMLEAAETEADRQGIPMSIAISDAGGNLLVFNRMDNAALFSINIAMDKAFTVVFGKLPSGNFSELYRSGGLVPLFFHERWITFQGGFPIIKKGKILGGIGVSGGTIEDIYVARAALKAGEFSLDEVNMAITQRESSK